MNVRVQPARDVAIEREQVRCTVDTINAEVAAPDEHKRIQPIGGGLTIYLGV